MKSRIQAAVSSYREEMIRFTQTLVGIPTENPPGHFYDECVAALAGRLEELGLAAEVREVHPDLERHGGLPRYWIESFFGDGKRTLYFHGHYDVVPGSSPEQFRPHLDGERLFGRGAADMKGGLTAMVYAMKALKDGEVPLDGRVGLVLVPDEETGGALGSRYLAEAGLLGREGIGMLTAEPTSSVVWNASRGAISLRVTVRGRAAHVGLHYLGVNAFETMLVVAQALFDMKREVESRRTRFAIEPEAARQSILMLGGEVEGGHNFNVVPAQCTFTVDRRINPEEDLMVERKRLLDLFERLREKGFDLDVEVIQEGASAGVPEDSPMGRALAASIEEVTGKPARFEMCPGLLEIRFYAERGIPALACGPGRLDVSHGPEEFVEVGAIESTAAVYALTAARLLGAH